MPMLNHFGPTQGVFQGRLVSFRKRRGAVPVSTVYTTTTAAITFSEDLTAGGGAVGFVATVNALPNAVVSAILTSPNVITVTWTTPGVSTNAVVIDYAPGAWVTAVGGDLVAAFQVSGSIP